MAGIEDSSKMTASAAEIFFADAASRDFMPQKLPAPFGHGNPDLIRL